MEGNGAKVLVQKLLQSPRVLAQATGVIDKQLKTRGLVSGLATLCVDEREPAKPTRLISFDCVPPSLRPVQLPIRGHGDACAEVRGEDGLDDAGSDCEERLRAGETEAAERNRAGSSATSSLSRTEPHNR